jgi:hypothetical protein
LPKSAFSPNTKKVKNLCKILGLTEEDLRLDNDVKPDTSLIDNGLPKSAFSPINIYCSITKAIVENYKSELVNINSDLATLMGAIRCDSKGIRLLATDSLSKIKGALNYPHCDFAIINSEVKDRLEIKNGEEFRAAIKLPDESLKFIEGIEIHYLGNDSYTTIINEKVKAGDFAELLNYLIEKDFLSELKINTNKEELSIRELSRAYMMCMMPPIKERNDEGPYCDKNLINGYCQTNYDIDDFYANRERSPINDLNSLLIILENADKTISKDEPIKSLLPEKEHFTCDFLTLYDTPALNDYLNNNELITNHQDTNWFDDSTRIIDAVTLINYTLDEKDASHLKIDIKSNKINIAQLSKAYCACMTPTKNLIN